MEIKKNNKPGSRKPNDSTNKESAPQKPNVKLKRARSMRKVRFIVNDPYATESSDDEDVSRTFVREVYIPFEVTNSNRKPTNNSALKRKRSFRTKRSAPNPVTGKYRGVIERPWGTFAAQIHDPFQSKRIWLGTYKTALETSQAYERKRLEFEALADEMNSSTPSSRDETSIRETDSEVRNKYLTSNSGNKGCKAVTDACTHLKPFEDVARSINDDDELLEIAKIGEEFDLDFDLNLIITDDSFVEPWDDLYSAIGGTENADMAVADMDIPLPDIDFEFKEDCNDQEVLSWIMDADDRI